MTVAEGTAAPVGVGVADPDSTTFTYSWTPTGGLERPDVGDTDVHADRQRPSAFAVTVCDDGVPQACTTLANAAVVIGHQRGAGGRPRPPTPRCGPGCR